MVGRTGGSLACGVVIVSNSTFKANFSKLLQKAGDKADLVVRKTALELQSMMIERSPVKSGRFRGNWQAGTGTVNTDTSAEPNSDAQVRTQSVLQGWKPGQTIFLTNSMSYSSSLERGHSKQAPYGMVRLTIQNYASALAKAVSEIK